MGKQLPAILNIVLGGFGLLAVIYLIGKPAETTAPEVSLSYRKADPCLVDRGSLGGVARVKIFARACVKSKPGFYKVCTCLGSSCSTPAGNVIFSRSRCSTPPRVSLEECFAKRYKGRCR